MTRSRYRGSLAVWALLIAYASLYPFAPLRLPPPDAVVLDRAAAFAPDDGDQSVRAPGSV